MSSVMASQRTSVLAAAAPPSFVAALDEDAQVEVLLAAKAARVLAALASSSKQLCRLARSRVPVQLRITKVEHAELVIRSDASGRPPWSACTRLIVAVDTPASGLAPVGVVNAAQQWTALQQVDLTLSLGPEQLQPHQTLDSCNAGILGALPALKGLRCLRLHAAVVGVCSARQLARLVHLARLELGTPGAAAAAAAAAPADLSALSGMTSLVQLVLSGPAVKAAAGGAGPFCFPSSLTLLDIGNPYQGSAGPDCITRCLTHLPGCPALQELRVQSRDPHPSASASALVGLLAQHNTRLRRLEWATGIGMDFWGLVGGLQVAGALADRQWRPDASLAALKGLASLDAGQRLHVEDEGDWQHLAQLTALTQLQGVYFLCVPPRVASLMLAVLQMDKCWVQLGGYGIGRILLACPGLRHARICLLEEALAAVPPSGERLTPHPSLQSLQVGFCSHWGPAAAAHWSALAPVVAAVSSLTLNGWPGSATRQPQGGLPDLSPCTALKELVLRCQGSAVAGQTAGQFWLEQEDFLLMLRPLVHLRCLEVSGAPRLNARVALVLQARLPRLKMLRLCFCGRQAPLAAADAGQQQQEAGILGKVKELLDGLELVVL